MVRLGNLLLQQRAPDPEPHIRFDEVPVWVLEL
jgi:hypothetical protein